MPQPLQWLGRTIRLSSTVRYYYKYGVGIPGMLFKESRLRFQESSFMLSQGKALAIQAGAPAAILDHESTLRVDTIFMPRMPTQKEPASPVPMGLPHQLWAPDL